MQPLPIDPLLPEVIAALRAGPSLVIEAPPGAGKTTRVPRAVHEAGLAGAGEVVVLEPRRLAARMAARRVAEELGERPGETVGYQVRFDEVAGPRTRIRYVTEGLLTRRLLSEPALPGVGAVVLDELHERHLQGDLALAFLRRLQRTSRPDLKLVAMSATLDAGPVAAFLGAPALRSEGRRFEVAVEHLSPEEAAAPDLRLEERVARAVRRLHREGIDGDVLVFLPGAAEIRRAREALAAWAATAGVDVLPLHGDLPPDEQDRAVRPGPRPKVILSTNVAETSITIDGVVAVVDSGLARIASHSPWSGLPTLEVKKISRASAAQRAGRAGRTRPGRAVRLYTRHDHDARPEFEVPEVLREDLSETLLALAGLGAAADLEWLEPPPAPALEAARALLADLGAVDAAGAPTAAGRAMLRFPLHPRLGRLLVEAAARGVPDDGALLAALLGERDLRERRALEGSALPPTGPSDLLELAQAFEEAARARFDPDRLRRMGVSPGAAQAVERSRRQLQRLARSLPRAVPAPAPGDAPAREAALLRATLAAYPDRVARRRAPGSDEVVLVGGGSARLDPASVVREAPLLVAVDAEARRGDRRAPGARAAEARVRLASAVTQELLLDLFPEALRYDEAVQWNAQAERVEVAERLLYRELVLEEARAARPDPDAIADALAAQALARGARAFAPEGALDALVARMAFAAEHAPEAGLAAPGEAELAAALREAARGRRSFAELREADLPGALLGRLEPRARATLERLAPERVTLPGGRTVRIHYEAGKPPWIESRLQDFFGLAQGPAAAGGRVPLVLHLLAPNQRAVQVTTDLAGFWDRHYPALRRELSRRYPRHAWPEDPRTAAPPAPRRR
ncbi:ATP-dependent helicase HrpB [Anaeromyxobacter dehalogenans 2CP-1]|uniref:ATP-dependent helicase HrpB n=1 Tax=Anaeromyxobacter dehalogenans (strain ATCC BAA-258 / DSM 21875 / 2CP-1) TaxID=455488 RepID=B8JDU6_ANAD2|nr:ATP-dependent helicase HrpB [Anaeromyxobacter dehalogenans]ACL64191.1 ATP-dependent helicase HrpB [Anaeromyxobacter dehalogenans 2CP-1]